MATEGSKTPPPSTAAPPPDIERPPAAGSDTVVTSVVRRWGREDLKDKSTLLLRALACVFSLISFLVMASNKHGDWKDFDKYEEYRYCLAVGIMSFLYVTVQIFRQIHRFRTGIDLVPRPVSSYLDFTGDQIIAYMLISATSAAIPMTNRMREGADNMFTDASSASISTAFFAFVALAVSALISGFKLSKQAYI